MQFGCMLIKPVATKKHARKTAIKNLTAISGISLVRQMDLPIFILGFKTFPLMVPH